MGTTLIRSSLRVAAVAALLLGASMAVRANAADAGAGPGADLRAKYAALKDQLAGTAFRRRLQLESTEGAGVVSGEIHAVVDHSFALTSAALTEPSQWCDILILPLNTKYCRSSGNAGAPVLHIVLGTKNFEPVGDGFRIRLGYRVAVRTADYLQVNLESDEGPLGTRDFRIVVAMVPADDDRTFIRLSYSYTYGSVARLAMQAYLGTIGHDKVGFTVVGRDSGGEPRFVGGTRGVIERNTMRYYLALEAFLGALSTPPGARVAKTFADWFAATEAYPRQLHEIGRAEYLDMKRREYARQQARS